MRQGGWQIAMNGELGVATNRLCLFYLSYPQYDSDSVWRYIYMSIWDILDLSISIPRSKPLRK